MKFDPITAKNKEIKIMDENIITNSMIDESIISFFEKPKILNIKF